MYQKNRQNNSSDVNDDTRKKIIKIIILEKIIRINSNYQEQPETDTKDI